MTPTHPQSNILRLHSSRSLCGVTKESSSGNAKNDENEPVPYRDVITQLLQNPRIEKVLQHLIVPRVRELFSDRALEFLQVSWNAGTIPDISYLKAYNINIEDASPFLEVNKWYKYVERWGDFAGIWFEEMDGVKERCDRPSRKANT